MKIKIIDSFPDHNGNSTPNEMIGKEYEVLKTDLNGVWVKEGKLEAFVQYKELEIIELGEEVSMILSVYLKHKDMDSLLKEISCKS
jgi:hypothetical protein